MSYSSFADYHRQRAASSASALKRRAQKWFYDEDDISSKSSKSWADWSDEELFDADAYDGSGYSASSSLSNYWGGGSSYSWRSDSDTNDQTAKERELARALKAVARSCNAIRATVGRGKDLSLKVKWGSGYEGNNVKQNDTIVLSPDTILKKDVKANWTEGKRSDALVGDALTAAAQKRTVTPSVVNEALIASETDRDAATARVLWSAVETDAAQQALLNDYRGAAVYFAASNAFHSSDEYRNQVERAFNDGKTRKSDAATVALAWNILHQKKLELPDDVKEATATAMREFASAKTCRDRWQASLRAVKLLRGLDPEQPPQPNPEPSPENPDPTNGQGEGEGQGEPQQPSPDGEPSGNANDKGTDPLDGASGQIGIGDLLGDTVRNADYTDSEAQDVEEIAEEADDVNTSNSHLEEEARHTQLRDQRKLEGVYAAIVEPSTKALLAGYHNVVRRLSSLADLFSTVNTCESYGRRSGQLDESKLWSVPSGESNVFFRRDESGEKREVSIAVLVDLSGSTYCRRDTCGSEAWADLNPEVTLEKRVEHAKRPRVSTALKRAAVILSEALRASDTNCGVRVHTYGHCSGVVEYYGPTSNVVQGDMGGGTDESGALARTVQHLLENDTRECRKIVICVGDGETSAECLRRTVEASNRIGVEVYSVLIRGNAATAKAHGEKVFGKGRFCALATREADKLPSVLTSFVTRVLSKAA